MAAAHESGVAVALDNTYAAGVMFDAFYHGVDVSIQALTKYIGGHSDLLLGSVSTRDENAYETLGPVYRQLGMAVSPDDCSLALRGLQTLAVRLSQLEKSSLEIAIGCLKVHTLPQSIIQRCHLAQDIRIGSVILPAQPASSPFCSRITAHFNRYRIFLIG